MPPGIQSPYQAHLQDTGIPKSTQNYLQHLTANFPLHMLRVRNGQFSTNLQDSFVDFEQRKRKPCGSAYLGPHQFEPPNRYRLSYFEAGKWLKATDLFIIFNINVSCLITQSAYLISYPALSFDHFSYLFNPYLCSDWFPLMKPCTVINLE